MLDKENEENIIIPFGFKKIDELFDGGLRDREITLIYGDYGTGKTLLCFMAALNCLREGFKVIYITTEKPFTIERMFQLAEKSILKDANKKEFIKNLIVISPEDFNEQIEVIYRLELFVTEKVKLIVFDSITDRYREILSKKNVTIWANKVLNEQMAILKYIAKTKKTSVIITGHVINVVGSGIEKDVIASKVVRYWCDNIIRLERVNSERTLIIEVKKGCYNGTSIKFKITSEGVVEWT